MSSLHYMVYPKDDVDSHMSDPTCVTNSPRYTLDGSEAILKFTQPVDDWITHEAAVALVQTPAWLPPQEIPQ